MKESETSDADTAVDLEYELPFAALVDAYIEKEELECAGCGHVRGVDGLEVCETVNGLRGNCAPLVQKMTHTGWWNCEPTNN